MFNITNISHTSSYYFLFVLFPIISTISYCFLLFPNISAKLGTTKGSPRNTYECASMCPAQLGWQKCIARHGCVYAYSSNKVSHLPKAHRAALKPVFGDCVAANGLIGSSPVGTEWKSTASDGIKVKAWDTATEKATKMYLSFPAEPEVVAEPEEEARACEEGVDANTVMRIR